MKKRIMRSSLVLALILITVVLFSGCGTAVDTPASSPITSNKTPSAQTDSEFARMLGYVPYSFLEEQGIWFEDPGKIKQLYNLEDITSIEQLMLLAKEQSDTAKPLAPEWDITIPNWRYKQLTPLIGFDGVLVDRIIYAGVFTQKSFSISEGNLDEGLIDSKLIEQGYTKTDYSPYSYYGIRDDYSIDLRNNLSILVLGDMNRIAILDDTIIVAPATQFVTGVFDAMSGDTSTVIDIAVRRW
jgi:hypothetical protein